MASHFSWFTVACICCVVLTSCDSGNSQSRDKLSAPAPAANSSVTSPSTANEPAASHANINSLTNSYVGSGGKFSDITKNQNSETPFSKINSKTGTLSGLDPDVSGINSLGPAETLIEPGNAGSNVLNSKINARNVGTVSTGTGGVSVTTIRSNK